jgi:uncharacterized protein
MSRGTSIVVVYNETKQTSLATRVEVADTGLSRLIGLLGRRSLQPNNGIWIVPSNSIHTFGMLFRFDLILIDKGYRVVGLRESIRPFTMTWPNFRARSVLELPVRTIATSRTEVGDQLRIEDVL